MTRPFIIHARHPGESAGRFAVTVREIYAEGYGADFQCVLMTRTPVRTFGLDKGCPGVYTGVSSQQCASDWKTEGGE